MSALDRYVGRIVLGAFGAALVFFVFLTVVVDLLNNVAKYADRAIEQGLGGFDLAMYLGLYYVKKLPVLFTMVTPFATVIACMFAVARLQHANEVVPMLFVGRSVQRILRPTLWLGRVLWKAGDGATIDGAIDGTARGVVWTTGRVMRLQTGYLYHYAFAMLIGVALILTWFMFMGGASR